MGTAGRIFMVNSERGDASKYQRMLENHGYEVFATGNPYKLIKYAGELRPQMYVMDVDTDNVNSWEVLHYLTDNDYAEDAPVVMINLSPQTDVEKGASHYIGRRSGSRKLLKIANAYFRGDKEYKILLIEDYFPDEEELAGMDKMKVSYFKVYDKNAAHLFLRKNRPQVVAIHSRKEDYEKIRGFLKYDKTFYVENQNNIKDLVAILH